MDSFKAGKFTLELGKKTYVAGILNITPDSFSDGGDFYGAENAREGFNKLIEQKADIIDIGAVSTRPGADTVTVEEEIKRLESVLGLFKDSEIPVSVDTFNTETASVCLEAGASIINDVSGKIDEKMISLVNKYNAAYIFTHNPGGADTVNTYPEGIITAERTFFIEGMHTLSQLGLDSERLCIDPGIGFGKSFEDNIEILRSFEWLKFSPVALMCGVSRKRAVKFNSFENYELDFSSAAAHTAAIRGGADFIRVHNVPAARATALMADRLFR